MNDVVNDVEYAAWNARREALAQAGVTERDGADGHGYYIHDQFLGNHPEDALAALTRRHTETERTFDVGVGVTYRFNYYQVGGWQYEGAYPHCLTVRLTPAQARDLLKDLAEVAAAPEQRYNETTGEQEECRYPVYLYGTLRPAATKPC